MKIDQYAEQIISSKDPENILHVVDFYLNLLEFLYEIWEKSDKLTPNEILKIAGLPNDVLDHNVFSLIEKLLESKNNLEKAILVFNITKQKLETR